MPNTKNPSNNVSITDSTPQTPDTNIRHRQDAPMTVSEQRTRDVIMVDDGCDERWYTRIDVEGNVDGFKRAIFGNGASIEVLGFDFNRIIPMPPALIDSLDERTQIAWQKENWGGSGNLEYLSDQSSHFSFYFYTYGDSPPERVFEAWRNCSHVSPS
jgi:hypothetical protein